MSLPILEQAARRCCSERTWTPCPGISASASEDFAVAAERVPSVFMYLSAGFLDERSKAPAHNPKARFNEDICAIGPAVPAHCATRWFE